MAQSSRTFRIFVSSTFSDLKAERNALQEKVFPRLRDLATSHGCRFQAIDLRWGVSEEAALDQQTMKICLGEIERCQKTSPRPNFIVLLGDRYGWRPLPYEIPADEFEKIILQVTGEEKSLLEQWYRRDDNAVPAIYVLQPRWSELVSVPSVEFNRLLADPNINERHEILEQWYQPGGSGEFVAHHYFREIPPNQLVHTLQPITDQASDTAKGERSRIAQTVEAYFWKTMENSLHAILEKATVSFSNEARLKFAASATEQEIVAGALKVTDAREHVFCFLRDIKGLPENGSATSFQEADSDAARKQDELKECLKQQLPGNIHKYTAQWQSDGPSLEHLDKLCEDVYAELSKVILAEAGKLETIDPLEREIAAHEAFGKDRARVFIGQANLLKAIGDYIAGSDPHPLAVWGVSGSGKSALMAKAVEQAQKNGKDVLYRFIGATPESSNGRALLESLCRQIAKIYNFDEEKRKRLDEIEKKIPGTDSWADKKRQERDKIEKEFSVPSDYQELSTTFLKFIRMIPSENQFIVFLDALDQLSDTDNARSLVWLPAELPENARLIISTLPGGCLQALESKLPVGNWLEVKPMSVEEGKIILTEWLSGVNRQLEKKQEEHLLVKFQQCGLPLYLKLAFEEARLWKSYDALPELSGDISGILRDLFKRLSLESNHGQMLVSRSLGYLTASKNGLSEDELLDVLSLDKEMLADFQRRSPKSPKSDRLPVVVWSRVYFDLEPYLTERSADGTSLLSFYHRQMSEACLTAYQDTVRHAGLAAYFTPQPLYLEKNEQTPNLRKLSEMVYQQSSAGLSTQVENTLMDYTYLEAKLAGQGVQKLIEDYALVPKAGVSKEKERSLSLLEGALRLSAHVLNKDPLQLPSQLTGRLLGFEESDVRGLLEQVHQEVKRPWLRPLHPCFDAPGGGLLRTLETHARSMAVTPDGRHVITGSIPHTFSVSIPHTVQVWDFETGECLRTLGEHKGSIEALAVTADGRLAVSGSGDKTLKVWDLKRGTCLHTLVGHSGSVHAVTVTTDGRRAVSGSSDKTVKIWDLETGDCLRTLEGHTANVNAVTVTTDGRRAISGSGDTTLKVWNLETGECLRTLKGPEKRGSKFRGINAVAITLDGRRVVTGAGPILYVWDLETGECLRTLAELAIDCNVLSVEMMPDGRRIISINKVWDLETGECLRTLPFGNAGVAAVTPDGRWVISGNGNVWDLEAGESPRPLTMRHTGEVHFVAVTPDGQRVISGASGDGLTSDIKVWDLVSGACLHTFAKYIRVRGSTVMSDGRRMVSSAGNVWDLESGVDICTLKKNWVRGPEIVVAVTPDGQQVVSKSENKTRNLKVWDLETGEYLRTLAEDVNCVAVTPDGRRAVITTGKLPQSYIELWDLERDKCVLTLETGHTARVTSVAVTADGRQAVSGSMDKTIKMWDLEAGECLRTLEGHTADVTTVAVTADGRRAVSGSMDKTIKVWDLKTGKCLRTLEGYTDGVITVIVTADGYQAVSGSSYGKTFIRMWDLKNGKCVRILETGHTLVDAVAVTPGGQRAIASERDQYDKTLVVWDLASGKCLRTLALGRGANYVSALATTPDGRRAVSGYMDSTLKVWNLETGECLRTLKRYMGGGSVDGVVVTSDGRRAVSWSEEKLINLKVWDLTSGECLRTLEGRDKGVWEITAVAVTSDGQRAVSGSYDKTLKVWDLKTGECLRTLAGHTQKVDAVAVTPDGRRAVSGSTDKTIKIWNLETGECLQTLEGYTLKVIAIDVTPDGRRAVSRSEDNNASDFKVWDLESGECLWTFSGRETIKAIALTPDGRWAVFRSGGTLKVSDLQNGSNLASFEGCGNCISIAPDGLTVAASASGHLYFLHLENVPPSVPVISAWDSGGALAFGCPHCRTWSGIPESALGSEIPCPNCSKPVKLNPFTIQGDWKPIEEAWKSK